jgi:hypothetical protein
MTAASAEEGSLSSKRSWNLKAESSFIYLNAGSAESGFGRTRLEVRYWAAKPHWRPDARQFRTTRAGPYYSGHPPEWSSQAASDFWQD